VILAWLAPLVVLSIDVDCHLASLARFDDASLQIRRRGDGDWPMTSCAHSTSRLPSASSKRR
jgi:hypothetical protein